MPRTQRRLHAVTALRVVRCIDRVLQAAEIEHGRRTRGFVVSSDANGGALAIGSGCGRLSFREIAETGAAGRSCGSIHALQ